MSPDAARKIATGGLPAPKDEDINYRLESLSYAPGAVDSTGYDAKAISARMSGSVAWTTTR